MCFTIKRLTEILTKNLNINKIKFKNIKFDFQVKARG